MHNFNISFEFVDSLGAGTLCQSERRWNGLHVWVNKRMFEGLSPRQQTGVIQHEAAHAYWGHAPLGNLPTQEIYDQLIKNT